MPLARRNGVLVQSKAGFLGKEPGCSGIPSMFITLTASDESLPITWCGRTWVKSTEPLGPNQAYSGGRFEICPSLYRKLKESDVLTSYYQYNNAYERWGRAGLNLGRTNRYYYNGTQYANQGLNLATGTGGSVLPSNRDLISFKNFTGSWYTYLIPYSGMNKVLTAPPPATRSDYTFANKSQFFGSHVNGGVTFTWEKGRDW